MERLWSLHSLVVLIAKTVGNGNLKGISALVEGMDLDAVIERVDGIRCGGKETSCPDQLATALKQAKAKLEG